MTTNETYAAVEARIQQALQAIGDMEKPNIAAVVREFNLPESRFRARLKGRQSRNQREGPNKKLTPDEELALCQYLNRLDEIGIPPRSQHIGSYANSILAQTTSLPENSVLPPTVSRMWTRRFLKRHPEYFRRKQKALDVDRKRAHHPEDLLEWYSRYKEAKEKHGVVDSDIYNFDETGFRIGVGRDQWVVTREPKRPLSFGSSSNQ
jgi:hypothetical protein